MRAGPAQFGRAGNAPDDSPHREARLREVGLASAGRPEHPRADATSVNVAAAISRRSAGADHAADGSGDRHRCTR
jgi:hypothetical protein